MAERVHPLAPHRRRIAALCRAVTLAALPPLTRLLIRGERGR